MEWGNRSRMHDVSARAAAPATRHPHPSVDEAVEDAADDQAAEDAAHHVAAAAASTAAPALAAPLPGVLRSRRVDVALCELQGLAREVRDPPGHRHRLLSVILVDDGGGRRGHAEEAVEVDPDALGLGQPGASVGADPAAVAGDDVAGDRELPVGVVDGVAHVLQRRDRTRRALAGRRDRGIQPRVRLAQATQLGERVGVDAGPREGGEGGLQVGDRGRDRRVSAAP